MALDSRQLYEAFGKLLDQQTPLKDTDLDSHEVDNWGIRLERRLIEHCGFDALETEKFVQCLVDKAEERHPDCDSICTVFGFLEQNLPETALDAEMRTFQKSAVVLIEQRI